MNFSCAPDGVRTSGLLELESDAVPIEPPRHPRSFVGGCNLRAEAASGNENEWVCDKDGEGG